MTVPGSSYPGNPALSPELRERVETTFRQSLELAQRGNRQEASLGCDFVLQLDPDYAPAQDLLDRLETGRPIAAEATAAGDATHDVSAAALFDEPGGREQQEESFGDLFELPELPEHGAMAVATGTVGAAAEDDDLGARLAELLASRRHGEAVELAGRHRERIAADPRLAELVETASARHEAAPYVERFVTAARTARLEGDEEAAQGHLEKVRALDPGHPELATPASDEPAAAAPAAAATDGIPDDAATSAAPTFDDPFAALGGSDEEHRIDDLLAEGQAASDRGDHQAAIDSWSRIFLIDIDHREAARRIGEARRLKAEQERRVEEVFHDAEQSLAAGDAAAARQGFERVLSAEPGHAGARQHLEDLEHEGGGLAAAIGEAASAAGVSGLAAVPAAGGEPLREEILVPPEPGEERQAVDTGPRRSLAVARESRAGRRFVLIGTVVLLLVAVAGYLLWENRESIFPNSDDAATEPVVEEDAIARATRLHRSGRTAIAINQLRRLPPTAPEYAEAQALISQWEAESATPAAEPSERVAAPDPVAVQQRTLVEQARAAVAEDDYLGALTSLEQAAELAPLEGEAAELQETVERQLAPVARLIELIRQGEHERALPDLWRRLEARPDDAIVRRLIVESYYRMGVRDLQRGDAAAAAGHLAEAAKLAPDDPLLARHQRFAGSYATREKDLLYRIYVKYLPPR